MQCAHTYGDSVSTKLAAGDDTCNLVQGISTTALKKACRKLGIFRWPNQEHHMEDDSTLHSPPRSSGDFFVPMDNNSNMGHHPKQKRNITVPDSTSLPVESGPIATTTIPDVVSSALGCSTTLPSPRGTCGDGRRERGGRAGECGESVEACERQNYACHAVVRSLAFDGSVEENTFSSSRNDRRVARQRTESNFADPRSYTSMHTSSVVMHSNFLGFMTADSDGMEIFDDDLEPAQPSPLHVTRNASLWSAERSVGSDSIAEPFESPNEDAILTAEQVELLWKSIL